MTHNTFAEFHTNPNLQPTQNRVAGFATIICGAVDEETVYAAFHDGSLFKAEVVPGTGDFFNHDSRVWVQVSDIPADAYFLGRYAPPPVSQQANRTDCREYDWTNG